MENMKNLLYLIPIVFYYLIESVIIGGVIYVIYILILKSIFFVNIDYFQWVSITWIFKMLLFNVYNTIPNQPNNNEYNNQENDDENNEYLKYS
jgi:hypothetical protein